MEQRSENPAFGRKVFFLNPTYAIQKVVIGQLKEEEYEVYVLQDYRYVKNILRHYPDSICFINVDEQLSVEGWIRFINSFNKDEILKTIYLGVTTERLPKAERDQFLYKVKIPAGMISLNKQILEVAATIKSILELCGAKGRRQYIRAQCSKDNTSYVSWTKDRSTFQFKLQDISSVGAAIVIPEKYFDLFKQNDLLRDLVIVLGSKSVKSNAVVFAIKDNSEKKTKTGVLFYTQGISHTSKDLIREYVFRTLDSSVFASAAGEPFDAFDYEKETEEEKEQKKKEEAFLMDAPKKDDEVPEQKKENTESAEDKKNE